MIIIEIRVATTSIVIIASENSMKITKKELRDEGWWSHK